MSAHTLKTMFDNRVRIEYCSKCGKENPLMTEQCVTQENKENVAEVKVPFASGLPIENH